MIDRQNSIVVDESGSMSLSDAYPSEKHIAERNNNRYGAVLQVCINFTKSRIQNTDDIYTFACHDNDLRQVFTEQLTIVTQTNESLEQRFLNNYPRFRRNNFELVFKQLYELASTYTSIKNSSHTQVIVFIGDGGDNFADSLGYLRKLVAEHKCAIYAVMIGTDPFGIASLQNIAKIAEDARQFCGKFMNAALDFTEIESVFKEISKATE